MTARGRQFAIGLQIGKDTRPTANPIADLYLHRSGRVEEDVHSRTELDKPHTLTALQTITDFRREHDSSRQQSGDLLENHGLAIAFDSNNILFILLGRSTVHGIEKFPALVPDLVDYSCDRGSVHMDIENAQKDADAGPLVPRLRDQ